MSNALLRRNSSKQGLQNLMRLTAQRSIEDAEEVERERRRRARDSLCRRNSGSSPGELTQDNETPTEESMYDNGLKPRGPQSLEEDEGFSDWTQRRERRRQQRLQELGQGREEDEEEEYANASRQKTIQTSIASSSSSRLQQEADRARVEKERRKEQEEEEAAAAAAAARAERARKEKEEKEEQRRREEAMTRRREEVQRHNPDVEKRSEVRVSYTSKVFLQQEPKHSNANGDARDEDVASHISSKAKITSRGAEQREAEAILEAEQRLEKIRRSLQEKESQEMELLKHRQAEAEQELEELKRRRETRRRVREEEERRKEEEEQQRAAKEEEERRRMREDIERRRMDAAERMKSLSTSSVDGEEAFSPISPKTPTHKITERTESLNRSLKKSNSFKKTQPFVLTAKIDDKMEQYAHAVENSQEARGAKASPNDLPSSLEAVTSKKSLFEAGDAWSPTKGPSCKDTDGLKVGVAGLITQWVKGPSDSSRQSLSRPADVKPGDVMQKKNMWEIITESPGRPSQSTKGSAGSKKYKFVVTGHGKYEKVCVDENGGTFTNGKSDFYNGGC